MNAPIITWLNRCLIKNTLDKATRIDEIKYIEVKYLFLKKRCSNVEKRKKLMAWLDGIPVVWAPHSSFMMPSLIKISLNPKQGLVSARSSFNKLPLKSPREVAIHIKRNILTFLI